VSGVAFDSREVGDGDLFVALKGERTDGHRYIEQAMFQGATGLIVSEPRIARRGQKRPVESMGKLEWDAWFDDKAERSRR